MGISTFSLEPSISVFTLRIVSRAGKTQSCVDLFRKNKNSPSQFLFASSPLAGVQKKKETAEAEVQWYPLGRKGKAGLFPAHCLTTWLSAPVERLERWELSHSMTFGGRTQTCALAHGLDPLV